MRHVGGLYDRIFDVNIEQSCPRPSISMKALCGCEVWRLLLSLPCSKEPCSVFLRHFQTKASRSTTIRREYGLQCMESDVALPLSEL